MSVCVNQKTLLKSYDRIVITKNLLECRRGVAQRTVYSRIYLSNDFGRNLDPVFAGLYIYDCDYRGQPKNKT